MYFLILLYTEAAEELAALHAEGTPSGVIYAKLGLVHRQVADVKAAVLFFNEALMLDA
ncbi:hypothetical protein [Thiocystis minor]|uniref:hypothetical protein n=1 Tax=Thiocystis minor TaxID=61597 RepID=UPI00191367CA|nr:hypothetical protein [Thiocystis minor]